jgi:AcrR family transcriptional regulator
MRVPAVERRQQLIDAAIRLMWTEGVERTSLRAIASEAGAPLASIHYCFEDKDALMRAAVDQWLAELIGTLAEDVEIEGGLRATLKRLADEYWGALEANPPNVLAQLELALWAMRGDAHQGLARGIYPRYEQVLTELFERSLDSAHEVSLVPTGLLARAFVGVLDAGSLQYLADPTSPAAKQVFHLMIDSLLTSAGL